MTLGKDKSKQLSLRCDKIEVIESAKMYKWLNLINNIILSITNSIVLSDNGKTNVHKVFAH